jgi:AraC family transcriptional regulator of adaptative response / DNA-3-methyladenine glycosylase II
VDALAAFLHKRQVHAVEHVDQDNGQWCVARTLRLHSAGQLHSGWLVARFEPLRHQLQLQVSDSLRAVLPAVIRRVRQAFDLDAEPAAINAMLHASFPDGDGLRVPGAFDGFELAVRAVLGQQITVAAARTLAQRLVNRFGDPLTTPLPGLSRLFPTAAALAGASVEDIGALGIVRQRQQAIHSLARAVAQQGLQLGASADVPATLAALRALPGIGDWTAQYIAMRALRWPDAFPAGDVALHTALGVRDHKHPARAAEERSSAWRPWRSYAVLRAWSTLAARAPASKPPGAGATAVRARAITRRTTP